MDNLSELVRGGTLCLSKAGVAIGGTTSKVKILAPNGAGVDFAIAGKLYHKADGDDIFTLTGAALTALYSTLYLLCLNASGTASVVRGSDVLTASVALGVPLYWPTPVASTCPVAAVRIDAGADAFTPGTTALTGGTVTVTYYDLFAVPDTPIVAAP